MEKPYAYQDSGFRSYGQWSFPAIVNVCVIRGKCPCNCAHCPVGTVLPEDRLLRFNGSRMPAELFGRIVDETSLHPDSSIRIHSVGEPLLWDEMEESIRYARSRGVLTWLFTSLVTNNRKLMGETARNCNIIEVSINSIDSQDYRSTKGIDAFDLVRENLAYISALSRDEGTGARIVVSRVESGNPEADKAFTAFWKQSGLVDDAFVRSYHSYNDLLPERKDKPEKGVVKCLVHWNRFNIDCDGTAVVCFNELFKESPARSVILGNVSDQPVSEIWHSEKLDKIRRAFLSGDLSTLEKGIPCNGCTSCQEEGGERKTSEFQISGYRGSHEK